MKYTRQKAIKNLTMNMLNSYLGKVTKRKGKMKGEGREGKKRRKGEEREGKERENVRRGKREGRREGRGKEREGWE